jgi:WD40 repeat protein
VLKFREPIARHVSHVYLSSLPFLNMYSRLNDLYSSKFSNILNVNISELSRLHLPTAELSFSSSLAKDMSRRSDYQAVSAFSKLYDANEPPTVNCISLSPDGDYVALGMNDTSVHIWDVQTGRPKFVLAGHNASIKTVSFGKQYLASGDRDGVIILWNSSSGDYEKELMHLPSERDSDISCLQLSPDEKKLAFSAGDFSAGIFDLENGEKICDESTLPGSEEWVRQ